MSPDPEQLRILLVEDDNLVAMLVEDLLLDLGHQMVKNPRNVAEALLAVAGGGFDAAILDVNIAGEKVFPVAGALEKAGIPFVFSSGYGLSAVPEEYRHYPVAPKPFRLEELKAALLQASAMTHNPLA